MPRMESNKVMSTEKATVIVQVKPHVKDNLISDENQQAFGAYHNANLKTFLRSQTKALGTVQIKIGVVFFLFGIVCSFSTFETPIFIFSGISYWGSVIYISAGSLSVVAQDKLHLCVVKASLGMNVISSVTAVVAIFLMTSDIYLLSVHSHKKCKSYEILIFGALLVFSFLQFIISIFISGFACKATCNTDSTVVNVGLNRKC
ncbi:membrane-spanning 4-domains subfamily A member 4A-like isoform X2 [Puntigrus tetrazona]|uniref:membrane-spanning 4-domains subfamily A member 4A-like isoform X2 n=1 Tax=Puntigrus tetrazona TaxID=1606681 RepID=UPI001C897248|nr:membrane-spanning 4-domains subfamily A member 4A-like isoform X2 [Puntigrus tetrazona]